MSSATTSSGSGNGDSSASTTTTTSSNNAALLAQAFAAIALVVAFQVVVARQGPKQQQQQDIHLHRHYRERKRRWQHAITGHVFVLISYVLPLRVCVMALLAGAAGVYYLRAQRPTLYLDLFGPLLRPEEMEETPSSTSSTSSGEDDGGAKRGGGSVVAVGRLPGAFYFLLGTAATAAAFPAGVGRYAVECLALADPVAAYAGRAFRSPRLNSSSSAAGSAACFVAAWIVGYFYLSDTFADDGGGDSGTIPWGKITVGALACTVAEAVPVVNDNLQIPLVTAGAVRCYELLLQSRHAS